MRRIAKLSLLLAPIFLASASGCATSNYLSSSKKLDPRIARVERLLTMAVDYENTGRPEAAMGIYEHVLAQNPENSFAKQRHELLASSGVTPSARPLQKNELRNQLAPKTSDVLMASRRPANQKTADSTQASVVAQASPTTTTPVATAESSPVIAVATSPASESPVVDHTTPKMELASRTTTAAESDWVSTSTFKSASKTETVVSSRSVESDWKVVSKDDAWVPTAKSAASEGEAEKFAGTSPDAKGEFIASAKPQVVEDWRTTDFTRDSAPAPVSTPIPAIEPSEESWEKTRLITLCDGLPEELHPLVEMLESSDPLVRVEGLQALAEHGEAARGATVAVHSMLEDREAVVSVYAASTLREIANDAWSSVQTLSQYLKHEDPQIVRLSAYLLGQMGPEAMEALPNLTAVRNGTDVLSSLHAAEALTHIAPADRESFDKLHQALTHSDGGVRWFAAVSLGSVEDRELDAAAALRLALKDAEPQVRAAACLSLGGLGQHASIAISDLEEAASSESSEVNEAAKTALACLRG